MTHKNDHFAPIRPETTPLYTASVYTFPNLSEVEAYYRNESSSTFIYRRNGHPNEAPVESILTKLEEAEAATLTASGMAAISAACFAHLRPGDHVLTTQSLYGGTYAFFESVLRPWGITFTYVDLNQSAELEANCQANTKMIYAESIANPLVQVADLENIGQFAQSRQLLFFVDNTFATPSLVQPLSLGATLSIHSLTKFLNGHSDVIGGAVVGSNAAIQPIRQFAVTAGCTFSPFDAWMTERGLKTFSVRFPVQCENAMRLSHFLQNHPAIERVYYPGLANHPTHQIAKKILHGGFGAMLSFEVKGGMEAASCVVEKSQHISFAPSLGGVHTTYSHPTLTSHRAFSAEQQQQYGIKPSLLRLSCGIESYEILEQDLNIALQNIG